MPGKDGWRRVHGILLSWIPFVAFYPPLVHSKRFIKLLLPGNIAWWLGNHCLGFKIPVLLTSRVILGKSLSPNLSLFPHL